MEWLKQHRSAAFAGSLFIIATFLLWLGLKLQEGLSNDSHFWPNLWLQLSGTAYAAFVVTIFFSFSDVQRQLANIMTAMFADGKIVRHLTSATRATLENALLGERLSHRMHALQPSLSKHLRNIGDRCLTSFHRHGYTVHTTLSTLPEDDRLLIEESITEFTILSHHLVPDAPDFEYRFVNEVTVFSDDIAPKLKRVLEFDATIGPKTYGKNALRIERVRSGGVPAIRSTFVARVRVDGEVHFRIKAKTLTRANDPIVSIHVRYPTHGFRFTIIFSEDFDYDHIWFKGDPLEEAPFPGRDNFQALPNGLITSTNEWLLPGEGVVVVREPKPVA